MKKYLLIACLFFAGTTAHSQILITLLLGDKLNSDGLEFGLEGGINTSTISGLQSNNYNNNWNLGFYFDIRIKNQWFLYTGVLVKSTLGTSNLSSSDLFKINASEYDEFDGEPITGDYNQELDYFIVPALAKYKFKNNLYAELGPQFGLLSKARVEFTSDLEGREVVVKEENRDNINRFDAGIAIGAGYTLFNGNGWTFGAKYYYGFVDVYKDISGSSNSAFFFKMNIPIGAVKNEGKEKPAEG